MPILELVDAIVAIYLRFCLLMVSKLLEILRIGCMF